MCAVISSVTRAADVAALNYHLADLGSAAPPQADGLKYISSEGVVVVGGGIKRPNPTFLDIQPAPHLTNRLKKERFMKPALDF